MPPGTEVSAKFKGAFCEAKVKKLCKSVKCKVLLKEAPFGSVVVEEHLVRGTLEVNQTVDVSHGKHQLKGVIQHVKDCSTYHVVFNDGDEKVLRRTQMCLKGAKHFDTESNLDQMPLYNPEQFCAAPKPPPKTHDLHVLPSSHLHSGTSDTNDTKCLGLPFCPSAKKVNKTLKFSHFYIENLVLTGRAKFALLDDMPHVTVCS
ncbi:unnamed protein product [Heligmosomoides polygyrus]|uniref:Tudor domain-containing protein n=1 Tax=Heligmosomoides polygyrus TaxID=6339 RepID=A0A3P8DP02_HELPZ|nr:unnamed protein product [Heligmosomoides polygyrus]